MDGNDAMASALLTSFNALIEVATPDRVVPVLRQAVTALLAEETPPARASETTPRPAKRSRTRWRGDIESWTPLRDKILHTLTARGISRRELAAAVKINHATLRPSLLPKGRAPGKANIAQLQGWLEAIEARDRTEASNSTVAPSDAASRPAYRLSTSEREQLAGWRELENERALRAEVGLATDVIDKAIAGNSLAPEIISRLAGFLAEQQTAAR